MDNTTRMELLGVPARRVAPPIGQSILPSPAAKALRAKLQTNDERAAHNAAVDAKKVAKRARQARRNKGPK